MDELRESVKNFLEENYDRRRGYYGVKCAAMAWTAEHMRNSRRPFTKVYDLVTEVVRDFMFGKGK